MSRGVGMEMGMMMGMSMGTRVSIMMGMRTPRRGELEGGGLRGQEGRRGGMDIHATRAGGE